MWRRIRYVLREFGYFSPTLKRGTLVLIILILFLQIIILTLRQFMLRHRPEIEASVLVAADSFIANDNKLMVTDTTSDTSIVVDPNTAPAQTFVKLGFPQYIANRIIHYREKGGKFFQIGDICKIYGIDTVLVHRLKSHWIFPERTHHRKKEVQLNKIELNSADTAMLEKLPGIGKTLATRIIKYRDLLGGYYTIEQLREVYGFSEDIYQHIASLLWTDTALIKPIPVLTASFRDLAKHPYIGAELAKKIEKLRKKKAPLSLQVLVKDSIITKTQAERLRWYCTFAEP